MKILLQPTPKQAKKVYEVEFISRYSNETEKELFSSFKRAEYFAVALLNGGTAKEYQITTRLMI